MNARSGGEHCKIHGFTYLQFKCGRFKTNQHQCRAEEISRLAHCATPYIWDDNCCFESRTKADTIPPPSWPLLSLETQQESRLIWVQKGRVTHRLLKNDVEVKSPNRMPPYKSPSPATPGGGLQGLQTTGREIYAWGNSQSLLASETSGKDRDGICLGIGRLDMSTCKLAAVTRHMGNLILFAGKKKRWLGYLLSHVGPACGCKKNNCSLVSDGKWPPALDPNKANISERTQRSAESSKLTQAAANWG